MEGRAPGDLSFSASAIAHWLLCAASIWPHMAIATEAPFAPLPNVPDYVATVFVKLYHGPTFQEVRTHHSGWTRVDGSFDQRAYRSTSYVGPGALFVTFAREPSAQIEGHDWLHIMRGPAMAHLGRSGDHPFKTGERQTLLGESCEIWNLSSRRWCQTSELRDARRHRAVVPGRKRRSPAHVFRNHRHQPATGRTQRSATAPRSA